jgi:hypothetical protein
MLKKCFSAACAMVIAAVSSAAVAQVIDQQKDTKGAPSLGALSD